MVASSNLAAPTNTAGCNLLICKKSQSFHSFAWDVEFDSVTTDCYGTPLRRVLQRHCRGNDVTFPKNLTKRGNVFYGRVAVPKTLRSLREAVRASKNPNEITRSLGTSERKVADRLLQEFLVAVHREFVAEERVLRAAGKITLVEPVGSDLAAVRRDFFLTGVREDESERIARKSFAEVEAMREKLEVSLAGRKPMTELERLISPGVLEYLSATTAAEWSTERRKCLEAELRKHLTESNYVLVSDVLEGMAYSNGLDIKPESLTYKALARGLLQEWLKVLAVADRRDQGIPDDSLLVDAVAAKLEDDAVDDGVSRTVIPGVGRSKPSRGGQSLRDHFESYLTERKVQLKASDRQGLRATLRQFIECVGEKSISEYRRSDMAAFKRGLQEYPSNVANRYPGVRFKKVIERNRKDGHPTLNSNTVRSKLSSLSAFGKWLESNADGVDATNFSTSLPKRDDRSRMEPFSLEEVGRILNSHAFVGCESSRNYQKPGPFKLRDWHFWLTLIAAFTGARVNEIVQMSVSDLQDVDGIWVFDITDDDDKSLKTKSSKRMVPVHPTLVDLGLIGYRDHLISSGATSLFDGAPVGTDGRRSESASRWFRRFLIKIGVKGTDDLGGAHRWRHTLVDALRRSNVDQYDIAAVTGHKIDISRMNGHYGREMDMSLGRRLENLSKADYPGVDFSLLKPNSPS